jgi:16S rRNA C1402 (ribose-2'-O) methylase RsmI
LRMTPKHLFCLLNTVIPWVMAREISKIHEEHKRGTLAEVSAWFKEHEPKGEIVIVVAGAPACRREHEERDYEKQSESGR